MKSPARPLSIVAVLVASCLSSAPRRSWAQGQVVAAPTAATLASGPADGVITEFNPGTMVVRDVATSVPVHYTFSKATTYVDEAGNRLSSKAIRPGLPVRVLYARVGDVMVAGTVIVRRTQAVPSPAVIGKKTTTTTTTTTER